MIISDKVLYRAGPVKTAKNPSKDFTSSMDIHMIVTTDSETIDALVSESKSHQRRRRRIHAGSNFPRDFSLIFLIFHLTP